MFLISDVKGLWSKKTSNTKVTRNTESQREEKRKYWREARKRYIQNMSRQKRACHLQKDRQRKQRKSEENLKATATNTRKRKLPHTDTNAMDYKQKKAKLSVRVIRKATVMGKVRKARYNKLSTKTKEAVRNFYYEEHISTQRPEKRFCSMKHGAGYLMAVSLKQSYDIFRENNPNQKIGFSRFCTLRPKNVKLQKQNHRRVCQCPYCENIKLKLKSLKKFQPEVRHFYNLVDRVLCDKPDGSKYHNIKCLRMECQQCCDFKGNIKSIFKPTLEKFHSTTVTWYKWVKLSSEDFKNKRILVTITDTVQNCVEELANDFIAPNKETTFPYHLFTASWQYSQLKELKESLQDGEYLCQMDFAKNKVLTYQDEIKCAYYSSVSVTVHPCILHYKKDNSLQKESLVFISNDKNHDYHLVQHITNECIDYIENKGSLLKKIYIFSDGCASQYKSKGPFADLSLNNTPINRNYLGSEHGKGEVDGEIGTISRQSDRAVIGSKTVFNNSTEYYNFCKENLSRDTDGFKRSFFYIDKGMLSHGYF
mgnify:CR=1 FL=1